jgi:hypothetical protein
MVFLRNICINTLHKGDSDYDDDDDDDDNNNNNNNSLSYLYKGIVLFFERGSTCMCLFLVCSNHNIER